MSTAASIRLPDPLRERIKLRAQRERRSFSNACRVLLEAGLAAADEPGSLVFDVDTDQVERLGDALHSELDAHEVT